MKVLIVTPHYYPYLGGLENYARNIAMGLVQRGHEVVVVTTGKDKKVSYQDGVTIYRLQYWFNIFNTPVNPLWRRRIRRLIKDLKPDVINAHTPVPYIADITERVRGRVPYVLTYHNDLTKNNPVLNAVCQLEYALLTNKTLRQATAIIGTSQAYLERSPYLGAYLSKAHVVAPGVDTALFTKPSTQSDKLRIVFVGQLHRNHAHKGLDVLIEAIAKLQTKGVELQIVGEGDKLIDYQRQVSHLELDNVTFLGRINDKELANAYQRASVLALPSTNTAEGFGMVILEAAACGIPSVASNVGGISEALKDNVTGILVPPGNVQALAAALDNILADKGLRTRLGNQAHTRAVQEFNWSAQAQKTETTLAAAIEANK